MKTFIAITDNDSLSSSWFNCMYWAICKTGVVKILKARVGQRDAQIVAEVDNGKITMIASGDYLPVKRLPK